MACRAIQAVLAPRTMGFYSQAVIAGDTVYITGPIPIDPSKMQLVTDAIDGDIQREFDNWKLIAAAAECPRANAVKLDVFITDMIHVAKVNEIRTNFIYPTRVAVGASPLSRGARVEIDGTLYLPPN
jgi:reactive intermediate/imine deaminase